MPLVAPALPHATAAQRVGILLSALEAVLFAFVAALHLGAKVQLGSASFATPFLLRAAIVEAVVALALIAAVLAPGGGMVRARRVHVAQVLAILGMFVVEVALMRASALVTWGNAAFYGCMLVLSLVSLMLIASPGLRRASAAH